MNVEFNVENLKGDLWLETRRLENDRRLRGWVDLLFLGWWRHDWRTERGCVSNLENCPTPVGRIRLEGGSPALSVAGCGIGG